MKVHGLKILATMQPALRIAKSLQNSLTSLLPGKFQKYEFSSALISYFRIHLLFPRQFDLAFIFMMKKKLTDIFTDAAISL